MNIHLDAAEALLDAGNFEQAGVELEQLRPGTQDTFPALRLWARLHAGKRRWSNVDVVCKVIRADYPRESFGFTQGAESLHRQARSAEAVELLKQCEAGLAEDPVTLYDLARYHCAIGNVLGASLLLGTAFSRDVRLRDRALVDPELRPAWVHLEDPDQPRGEWAQLG